MMEDLTPTCPEGTRPSRVGKGEQTRNMSEPVIEVRNVSVAYHRTAAIERINVAFPARAVTGIIGPNGAGKTTLLHTIMGMQPHQHGGVTLFGGAIRQARRRIA